MNDRDLEREETAKRLLTFVKQTGELLPGFWKLIDEVRRSRPWPSWCFVPLDVLAALVSRYPDLQNRVTQLAAITAWRVTQGIYEFDPTVFDTLIETPLEGDIPSDVLKRLPEWCVYISIPEQRREAIGVAGFFVFLDDKETESYLRLVIDTGSELLHFHPPLQLNQDSIVNGLHASIEAAKARPIADHPDAAAYMREVEKNITEAAAFLSSQLNLVLYLCSADLDMASASGKEMPKFPTAQKTKRGFRLFAPDRPRQWEVGFRIGAALRSAQSDVEGESKSKAGQTHARPRAHFRRSHWHTFWSGPRNGDRIKLVKWLPPILVNAVDVDELIPIVRKASIS